MDALYAPFLRLSRSQTIFRAVGHTKTIFMKTADPTGDTVFGYLRKAPLCGRNGRSERKPIDFANAHTNLTREPLKIPEDIE